MKMSKKPSVTELLDLLSKPALISWANKLGLQGIDVKAKRKASLAAGTSIHAQIEAGCFEREIDSMSFAAFLQGKEILSTEQDIETDWFVGRYDVHLSDGGVEYIADYKRGFKGKIYLEHKLQLVAYTMAKPAKMAIVPVPQFHLVPIEIEDRRPYEQMLIHLSHIWNLKKEIERA
jgi:predicted RecB family nuclease